MNSNKFIAALMALCTLLAVSCRNSNKSKPADKATENIETIKATENIETTKPTENSDAYSANVVVKNGECLGILIEEKTDTYVIGVQDDVEIPKEGAHVELWKAADGRGVVTLKDWGTQNVFSSPDDISKVIGTASYEEGYLPEAFPCLGLKNGWFKIQFADRQGYIQAEKVDWTALCTF